MSKSNDINFDESTDILINLEQMDARLSFLRKVYKQTNDFLENIKLIEQYLYQSIKSGEEPFSKINENLNQKDIDQLELVSDYIEYELYPMYKDNYVLPYIYNNVMHYYNCSKDHDEAIAFTNILDIEYVILNTCINIMKNNDGFMRNYSSIFNYKDFNDLYNFVYEMYDILKSSRYGLLSKTFNISNLYESLDKLSEEELFVFTCFVSAKQRLLLIKDRNRTENLETDQFVNNTVYKAYDMKSKKSAFNRN